MSGLKKLKQIYFDIIKEHKFSFVTVLLAFVIATVLYGYGHSNYDSYSIFLSTFLIFSAFGIVLCETIHKFKKAYDPEYGNKKKKYIILYTTILVVSIGISLANTLCNNIIENEVIREISEDYCLFYIISAVLLSIYFFYKKSGEKFETYIAKAFCSMVKAQVVYMILAIGFLILIGIVDSLLFDSYEIYLIERVELMLVGLVEFPCLLAGFSKTSEELDKFCKALFSYVFMALLGIAYVIIYAYIIKIVVTWTFPSNEVFSILTGLFVCSVSAWFLALGSNKESMEKTVNIMHYAFIPFIVLQIMCLSMRVSEYGFTASRYFGMALIVFEIIYIIFHAISSIKKWDKNYYILYMGMIAAFIVFIMPFVNVNSVVFMSQKARIEQYFKLGDAAELEDIEEAKSAFRMLERNGGLAAKRYIEKNLTDEQVEELSGEERSVPTDDFSVSAFSNYTSYDVSSYKTLYFVDEDLGDRYYTDLDLSKVPIYAYDFGNDADEEIIGYADLSDIVNEISKLQQNADKNNSMEYQNQLGNVIDAYVPLSDGGVLKITNLVVRGDHLAENPIESISIEGYVFK
ncbi:protein of unknown function [Butyrivibrio hungatei DSM 14810]|uniref:DUF4153 domain-containing protein n=1 Tax=Butyrivibrio hungatei DSM 14810 TaxID=1121132 RepID=A0A1M7SC44_9FIRM|nr:DUF4153 domain-containing protein [Butyrivibrio hungatei]SHN56060.1 protein of unknown function [Butyrivibrio hungatei DSM 14810]